MNIQKWFEGEVVDINDPEKLGRVKVRETLGHSNRVAPEDLFWSHVLMPPTGANAKGVGVSPVGLTEDSKVIGFRINETLSYVIGSVAYAPNEADHSVSRQSRGVSPVKKDYIEELGEKKTKYDAKYPYNKTITTSSGHVLELDDTPKAERIHVYHKSGSYIEIFPDGTIITKSMKDSVSVTMNDHAISVVKGTLQIVSNEGMIEITSDQDINLVSKSGVVNIRGAIIGLNG